MDLLEKLSTAIGIAGREDEVRDLVIEAVTPLVDSVYVDPLGSVIATRKGIRDDVLLLDAHLDEVGFFVALIEGSGFIRLGAVGGWDPRVLPAQPFTVKTENGSKVRGVIGTTPPHALTEDDRKKILPIESLFLDVGARSDQEVAALGIAVGDQAVPDCGFERFGDDLLKGKAFDDRAGCYVGIETLRNLQSGSVEMTVVAAFVTSEEVGLRGARAVAPTLNPKIALALEGTTAVDIPGVKEIRQACRFGGGAAITIADPSLIADRGIIGLLDKVAADKGIKTQKKIPMYGGSTDAGAIALSPGGVRCGVVSVPCRYIHTANSLLRPSDLQACVDLVTGFALRAHELL